jgi:branched-chain amino acid transport system permease protein
MGGRVDFWQQIAFQTLNGIVWGMIVALLAVGLNLIYGLLGIVNVAQGALYMLGAVLCWYVERFVGDYVLSVILAAVLVGIFATGVERALLRRILAEHEMTIIMTIGLMLIFEQGALGIFGGNIQSVAGLDLPTLTLAGIPYPGSRLMLAGVSLAVLGLLWAFLQFTRYGLWMRAVKHDPDMAKALGVPVNLVFALTFGIGAGLAALGGGLAAPIVGVRVQMGVDILVTVFIVVIVGGLGNLPGSVLVAVLLLASEGLATVFVDPTNARVLSLALMTAIILAWPNGILNRRTVRIA